MLSFSKKDEKCCEHIFFHRKNMIKKKDLGEKYSFHIGKKWNPKISPISPKISAAQFVTLNALANPN